MYKLKTLSLAVLVGVFSPVITLAQESEAGKVFVMKPVVGDEAKPMLPAIVPSWSTASVTYTPWANSGAMYDCSEWEAPVSLVNLFESFEQTRVCQQDQNRTRSETLASERLGNTRSGGVTIESRTITVNQSQLAQGTRDYITDAEAEGPWSPWTRVGSIYGCDAFSPAVDTVNEGETFTQSRTCSEDQTRSRDVFEEYRSGNNVFLRTEDESQTVPFNDTREAVGTYVDFYVVNTVNEYSRWVDDRFLGCGDYSPSRSSVLLNEPMTQSSTCTWAQVRDVTVFDVYNDGTRIEVNNYVEDGTRDYSATRNTTGTNDPIVGSYTAYLSDWEWVEQSCTAYPSGYENTQQRRQRSVTEYYSGRTKGHLPYYRYRTVIC